MKSKTVDVKKAADAGGLGFQRKGFSVERGMKYRTSLVSVHYGIFDNQSLTGKPTKAILQNVPGHITRHDLKKTKGGNVTDTKPPNRRCGFFMPAILGDFTYLPGVVDYEKPATGKVHSVSFRTLQGTRQFYCHLNLKKSKEEHAMQNATIHATTTPVVNGDKGLPPIPTNNTRCLFPTDTLLNAIIQAKAKHQRDERGAAYQQLLKQFHQAILPAFLIEAGSISKASNLLGLHRETLSKYIDHAGINLDNKASGGLA